MSFYVKRWKPADPEGTTAWVGPIRSISQASTECQAWQRAGWRATGHEATPAIRAMVKDWERDKKARKKKG